MNVTSLPKLKAELDRLIQQSQEKGRPPRMTVAIGLKVQDLPRLRDELDKALRCVDYCTT